MGLYGTRRALLKGKRSYSEKVLGYSPIAYWPLWEVSGTTARCLVNAAQNGTYTGVTLANATAPDGSLCPFFDGANDFVDIYSAALAGAYNGQEGTLAGWARVYNAGVWTDGAIRVLFALWANPSAPISVVTIYKNSAANEILAVYYAEGVLDLVTISSHSPTAWTHYAMSWSLSAGATGEVKFFINGIQAGTTQVNLGTWILNTLNSSRCNIGCRNNDVPDLIYHGWLSHYAMWDTALTPAQIADLATV